MDIKRVIEESILAIFSNDELSHQLVLKGGGALHFLEGRDDRLSTDLDFSIRQTISDPEGIFKKIEKALTRQFKTLKYDVIDFKYQAKPKKAEKSPVWYRGWLCQFKLSLPKHQEDSPASRSRAALIPTGSNSSNIEIEISEHEYCDATRKKRVSGITVEGYTKEALVLEKMRAICQQHPSYPYSNHIKNRARDFVDIYHLTSNFDEAFLETCRRHIKQIFEIKHVPIELLSSYWDEEFIDTQRRGFAEVVDSLKRKAYDFNVYLEHLRYLTRELWPSVKTENHS